MPLDVLSSMYATLIKLASVSLRPLTIAIIGLKRGILSKRKSSACVDYVPALCTHCSSLPPIEWLSEIFGLECLNCVMGFKWLEIVYISHLIIGQTIIVTTAHNCVTTICKPGYK